VIAKSIPYADLFKGLALLSTKDRKALMVGWAVAKYVAGLQPDEAERAALEEVGRVARYGQEDHGDAVRVEDRETFHLEGADLDAKALEFAYMIAAQGPSALRHIVVAYGQEPVTSAMAARHREIYKRILRAENFPAIYSKHGDTDYDHWHLALCLFDTETGKRGNWGQGMEIEALHIASAICEAQDQLRCEPNRRYVADESGVYHTWSGIKVANADGEFLNRGVFKAVRAEQVEFDEAVAAFEGAEPGTALPTHEAIRLLARGVIRQSKSWDDLHRGLARVGIRYDPVKTKGEITGGHLVAPRAIDKEANWIRASDCNAGYQRLVTRLGRAPYEAAAQGIEVRQFVAPAYRKANGETGEDLGRDLAIERKAQAEIDELEVELMRGRARSEAQVAAVKAERAKLASRKAKLADHNRTQEAAKAQRVVDEEVVAGLRLSLERETSKPKRGRPPKTGPINVALWGTPAPAPRAAGTWSDRYKIEETEVRTIYRLKGVVAIVETKSFIAVHATDPQSKADALLRAHEKFGTVKVTGTPEFRREMLLLATEMNIPLEKAQAAEARKLLSEQPASEVVQISRAAPANSAPAKPVKQPSPLPEEPIDWRRRQRCDRYGDAALAELHRLNREEDARRAERPSITPAAHKTLQDINCDELLLCSSIYQRNGIRFLDDEKLLEHFAGTQQVLLRPDIQQRLKAIMLVQRARREWILAGLASGQMTYSGEKLKFPGGDPVHARWLKSFLLAQKGDPTFARQMTDAQAAPTRSLQVDLRKRPELALWRGALGGDAAQRSLAPYIADELFRGSSKEEREAFFKTITDKEVVKLKQTEGLFAQHYAHPSEKEGEESAKRIRQRAQTALIRDQGLER